MRDPDLIRALYRGRLRPCDLKIRTNDVYDAVRQDLSTYGAWLERHLEGRARQRYMAVKELYEAIMAETAFEHFRSGLCLGLALMAQASHLSEDIFFESP